MLAVAAHGGSDAARRGSKFILADPGPCARDTDFILADIGPASCDSEYIEDNDGGAPAIAESKRLLLQGDI
jgi:hypothetical protein